MRTSKLHIHILTAYCSLQEPRREYYIIRGEEAEEEEELECRLEQALENGYPIIVIEPVRLGRMTIRCVS